MCVCVVGKTADSFIALFFLVGDSGRSGVAAT